MHVIAYVRDAVWFERYVCLSIMSQGLTHERTERERKQIEQTEQVSDYKEPCEAPPHTRAIVCNPAKHPHTRLNK